MLASQQQQQDLHRDLREVFTAGSGAMTLTVINATSAAAIIAAMLNGDVAAKVVLTAAHELLQRIERRTRTTSLPCLLCANTLWRDAAPAAIGVLLPYSIEPVNAALGMGICGECADNRSSAAIARMVVGMLRDHMMPDLREFHPVNAAGHA